MNSLDIRTVTASLQRGNVSRILGVLLEIHDHVCSDDIMDGVASALQDAIGQLRDLQRLAYETMMEIEAEQAAQLMSRPHRHKKPN